MTVEHANELVNSFNVTIVSYTLAGNGLDEPT